MQQIYITILEIYSALISLNMLNDILKKGKKEMLNFKNLQFNFIEEKKKL